MNDCISNSVRIIVFSKCGILVLYLNLELYGFVVCYDFWFNVFEFGWEEEFLDVSFVSVFLFFRCDMVLLIFFGFGRVLWVVWFGIGEGVELLVKRIDIDDVWILVFRIVVFFFGDFSYYVGFI